MNDLMHMPQKGSPQRWCTSRLRNGMVGWPPISPVLAAEMPHRHNAGGRRIGRHPCGGHDPVQGGGAPFPGVPAGDPIISVARASRT
jgi:hypothetical protein